MYVHMVGGATSKYAGTSHAITVSQAWWGTARSAPPQCRSTEEPKLSEHHGGTPVGGPCLMGMKARSRLTVRVLPVLDAGCRGVQHGAHAGTSDGAVAGHRW